MVSYQVNKGTINDLIKRKVASDQFSCLGDLLAEIQKVHKAIDKATCMTNDSTEEEN
ncbi:MAG: hypothetical protein Q4F95_02260 [Oscillospiraceae bacterium]|nr:hypothetical protein [Oscillospiraceae bacterium]